MANWSSPSLPEQAFPTDDAVVREALSHFRSCEVHQGKIRTLAERCTEFFIGGEKQWNDSVLNAYRAQKRPDLTFNQLPQFVYNVLNEQIQNPSEIKISPDSNGASEELSRIMQDMVRKVINDKGGKHARIHAHRDHIVGGAGYMRLITEFEGPHSFKQILRLDPIENCFSVYFDPDGTYPTYRDADYCILFHDMSLQRFREKYPLAKATSVAGINGTEGEWIQKDSIRVMEYIKVHKKERLLLMFSDGSQAYFDELQAGVTYLPVVGRRNVEVREVFSYLMTSYEQLRKPKKWVGSFIPIIPIIGEKITVKGETSIKGLLHDALDPQVARNFMQNEQLLAISTSTKSPWLMPEGMMENLEEKWEEANRKVFGAIPFKKWDAEGRDLGEPIRNNTEPPIQAVQMSINSLDLTVQQSMGIYMNALGNQETRDESGRAVLERKKQSKFGNSRFTGELNRALEFLGEQLLEAIPLVYDAPQVMELEGLDKKRYRAVLYNSESHELPHQAHMLQGIKGIFDLSQGTHNITVSTGPGYDVQREESQAFFEALAGACPELVPRFADLWARSMDFAEKDELADRLMPPDIAMANKDNPAAQMPALQNQLQQSQVMIQKLSQVVQELTFDKKAKITEFKGKMALAQQENEHHEKVADIQALSDLLVQASQAHQDNAKVLLSHEVNRIESDLNRQHDAHLALFQNAHELKMQQQAPQSAAV